MSNDKEKEIDWSQIYEYSRQQGVAALVYDGIVALPVEARPPRSVLFRFASFAETVERDNIRREKALCDFSRMLKERLGLATNVVKGSALAALYPQPLHRECGDNDLYTGQYTEAVAEMMEKEGAEINREDARDIAFVFEDTLFECHKTLLYHDDDIEWEFQLPQAGCLRANSQFSILNSQFSILPPEQAAFFLAKHTEHHAVFFHEPVRLRDLVDWIMLIGSEGFDYERFCDIKRGTDVEVFADLMTLYCVDLFKGEKGLKGFTFNVLRFIMPSMPSMPNLPNHNSSNQAIKQSGNQAIFEQLYMHIPSRHRSVLVRVARRSWHYLRYWRQYRAIYGMSMFRRFYMQNLITAIHQLFSNS